jgi:hypothetical protein
MKPHGPFRLGRAVEEVDLGPFPDLELPSLEGVPDVHPRGREAIEVRALIRWVHDVNGALAAPHALDDEREQVTIQVVGAIEQAADVTSALDLSLR